MSVTWIDSKFGAGCRAVIGNGLVISVEPDGISTKNGPAVPFKVTIFDASLKRRFSDRKEAKLVAEKNAKLWLIKALETFD